MVVSLSALAQGATPLQIGIIAALFAAFPLLLAVYAGKISDRIGVKRPIATGAVIMALGIALPFGMGGLTGLMAASLLIGLGHIFFHVSIHNLIGAYGAGEARTRNFATFSLGASISAFIGPSLAGFSIDGLGFLPTHAMLAAVAVLPAIMIAADPKLVPPPSAEALGMRRTVNKLTQIVVPLVFGGLGSAAGLLAVFWANGAFLIAGGFVSLAERRVASQRDAAAALAEQQEEDT